MTPKPWENGEGYPDPTAYNALRPIMQEAAADAREARLLRLRERIIKDTGEQDYSTSLCRKWLDEHITKTVHDAVSPASSHELKKPD